MLRAKGEAAQEAGVSAGVIDGLIDEGTLETLVLPPEPVARPPDPDFMRARAFTTAQRAAGRCAARERRATAASASRLLDGVTGSGKTEVYFEAVAEMIRRGQAGADPDARDRADRAVPRPLRGALRRAAGANGIRRSRRGSARAPGRAVAASEVQRRGRRALGAVPALCGSRPDHRR